MLPPVHGPSIAHRTSPPFQGFQQRLGAVSCSKGLPLASSGACGPWDQLEEPAAGNLGAPCHGLGLHPNCFPAPVLPDACHPDLSIPVPPGQLSRLSSTAGLEPRTGGDHRHTSIPQRSPGHDADRTSAGNGLHTHGSKVPGNPFLTPLAGSHRAEPKLLGAKLSPPRPGASRGPPLTSKWLPQVCGNTQVLGTWCPLLAHTALVSHGCDRLAKPSGPVPVFDRAQSSIDLSFSVTLSHWYSPS